VEYREFQSLMKVKVLARFWHWDEPCCTGTWQALVVTARWRWCQVIKNH